MTLLTPPATLSEAQAELWQSLCSRLLTLNERVWNERIDGGSIEHWLNNFNGSSGIDADTERLHALYILSVFMFFGDREIRVLLKALYRELFLLPIAQRVRSISSDVNDFSERMRLELRSTKFLGVGNPSESGVHLLYYFRQENQLTKTSFMDAAQIYTTRRRLGLPRRRVPRYPSVKRYVFIDDMCGSGETAIRYSEDLLGELAAASRDIEICYYALFATKSGMDAVRSSTAFGNNCGAVFELDDSYRWSSDALSRYLYALPPPLDREILIRISESYGKMVWPEHPLGFDNGRLLVGFAHNTPDNTLPIIWGDIDNGSDIGWYPIFKRYPKV